VSAYWRKAHMEEANLRQAFADGYLDYRRATWGAIPGLF
jgi:protein-S-isoprenylcysteine O-methyltransferase Ste14